jgi:glycosyltransferase involved in cell wall biosynthesis
MRPQTSVVIPAHDREAYLGEAIESVLAQNHESLEIIVVDDGSTDRTAEIAESYRGVRCVRRDRGGPAAARNTGVALAHGELLAFLDSDDRWSPTKLERQLAAMAEQPEAEIVLGHVRQFLSPELADDVRSRLHCPVSPMPGYVCGALLVPRAVLDRIGRFDERLRVGEFIDWYGRAEESAVIAVMLEDVVLERRLHAGHLTADRSDLVHDFPRLLKARLDRRRARARND